MLDATDRSTLSLFAKAFDERASLATRFAAMYRDAGPESVGTQAIFARFCRADDDCATLLTELAAAGAVPEASR